MTHVYSKLRLLFVLCAALHITACASIAGDDTNRFSRIESVPNGAECEVINSINTKRNITTPAEIFLQPKYDPINVTCTKNGHKRTTEIIDTELVDAVYGNIMFGGLIGVAIDHESGQNREYPPLIKVFLEPEKFASKEERNAFYNARNEWRRISLDNLAQVQTDLQKKSKDNAHTRSKNKGQLPAKKIAIGAWGELNGHKIEPPVPVYSGRIAGLMDNILSLTTSGDVVLLNWREAKDVNYESTSNPTSRSICARTKADLIYIGVLEVTAEGGNAALYPDTTYYTYDCSKNTKRFRTYTLDLNLQDGPDFKYEYKLNETFRQYLVGEGLVVSESIKPGKGS